MSVVQHYSADLQRARPGTVWATENRLAVDQLVDVHDRYRATGQVVGALGIIDGLDPKPCPNLLADLLG